MRKFSLTFASLMAAAVTFGPQQYAVADEICRPCPFSCRNIGFGRGSCDNLESRRGLCCVYLEGRAADELRDREARGYWGGHHYGRDDDRDDRRWKDKDKDHRWKDRADWQARNDYSRRNDPGAYDDRHGFRPGDCPRGYHVNDRGCTGDERRNGCSDLRSPSGQMCVGWNVR